MKIQFGPPFRCILLESIWLVSENTSKKSYSYLFTLFFSTTYPVIAKTCQFSPPKSLSNQPIFPSHHPIHSSCLPSGLLLPIASWLVYPDPLYPTFNLFSTLQTKFICANTNLIAQLIRSLQLLPIVLRVEIRFPPVACKASPSLATNLCSLISCHSPFVLSVPATPPFLLPPHLAASSHLPLHSMAPAFSHALLLDNSHPPLGLCFIYT